METWDKLPPKNCTVCNYPLGQHGTGLGISNDYLPCEYCFLKDEVAHLKKQLHLEWMEGYLIGLEEGQEHAQNL